VFVPSPQEAELYRLIRGDGSQQRVQVVLDPRLCRAARAHAVDTQQRRFFGHVNPDGANANQRALQAGYPLPAHYSPSQNFIESMAGSVAGTPADALAMWRNSAAHAPHVFGQVSFYREQVVLGVGHAPASGHGYATYVFLSAPLPNGEQGAPGETPRPALAFAADGGLSLHRLPAEAILEVWKAGPALEPWVLDRTTVIGSSGRIGLGMPSGGRGFFRLGYFRR
jgi:hypothetical protein